jgi:hypothetical protein
MPLVALLQSPQGTNIAERNAQAALRGTAQQDASKVGSQEELVSNEQQDYAAHPAHSARLAAPLANWQRQTEFQTAPLGDPEARSTPLLSNNLSANLPLATPPASVPSPLTPPPANLLNALERSFTAAPAFPRARGCKSISSTSS